ncbi:MAG: ribonuclease HII [Beijerinckiaceae bacterium]|nr:ribonuclease HII [Beijerinckiaceae bacterium]
MGMPDFAAERTLLRRGIWPVAGIDEAGRGPLAGPVAAAAVILDPRKVPPGLNDSKLLPPKEREGLYETIMLQALAVSVAFASAAEIDEINIRQGVFSAMRRALAALTLAPRQVLIDGKDLPSGLSVPAEAIVKGDGAVASIAAASIIAKVTRDRLMRRYCDLYPVYGFSKHFGYGTKAHLAAIAEHGPCPQHRLSFRPFKEA